MPFTTNSSTIGVDLNNTNTTQLFALGTTVLGDSDSEWVYCQAASAVTAFKAVMINATFTCGMVSGADAAGTASGLSRIGFPQNAFAASEFGWVPIRGHSMYVMMTGSSTAIMGVVPICVAASAVSTGMCSMVATSSGTLAGVTIFAHGSGGQTASATAARCIITWPRIAANFGQ